MLSENRLPPESLNAPAPPSAEAAWHGVFTGRYRIAAWYDRGGRRYLVAKPQSAEDDTGLTVRQRRLLAMRLRGTALKVMAMEHGLSIGTISRDLTVAMERLGLASVSDLAAVLGHVGR